MILTGGVLHMRKIIENVRFVQDGTLVFGDIHLEDGFVERVDYKTLQMSSDYAINGFIDLHTHGFRGYACDSCDVEELKHLAMEYAKRGVVGFCAALKAKPLKEYEAIIQAYEQAFQGEYKGARFLGLHIEGPYLNPLFAGSQNSDAFLSIDTAELEQFLKRHHGMVKTMTIAPELPHAMEAIKILHRYGICISLGYSGADYETCIKALEEGASRITHLCNTMPDINHKKPGLMDVAFTKDIMCELNLDGSHVNDVMLSWLLKVIGTDRIMAVTDGGLHCGFEYPDGFELENGHIVQQRAVYNKDGILCGSTKDLLDAFQKLKNEFGYDLIDCVKLVSGNAGKLISPMTSEFGLGKKVQLIVLDHNLEIKDVIINGKSVL